jgi:hypothetical protein
MNELSRLKKYTQNVQEQLKLERESKKNNPNQNMADEGKSSIESYQFWCKDCKFDFTSSAHRYICRIYGYPINSYWTRCPECKRWCKRLISHRDHDPYYNKSKVVLRMRNENAQDILQPGQFGYNTLWT